MKARGLVAQTSPEAALAEHLAGGARTVYCGFDPTADSLHIGNLVPLLALRRFQLAGHSPILLLGGATGLIGDPGGRDSERELQPKEQVAAAIASLEAQARSFLDFDCGKASARIANNADWTQPLSAIDFLRDIGKHFSVNAMLQKETVKRRIEDPALGISYTEFSYMLLQSYDFVMLNERHGCTIQVGGSDQWGNISAGIDLVRRMRGVQAHAMTYPLVTRADGAKFGKSAAGAVWLSPARTSPYAFYQFWLNTADADAYNFLRFFTFLDVAEIAEIEKADRAGEGRPQAQAILAKEVTRLVHGEAGLQAATRITDGLFTGDIKALSEADLQQLRLDGLPTCSFHRRPDKPNILWVESRVAKEMGEEPPQKIDVGSLPQLLTEAAGSVVTSGKQVKDALAKRALSVNGDLLPPEDIADLQACFPQGKGLHGRYYLVRLGRKKYHLFEEAPAPQAPQKTPLKNS